ncbi:hypothetical protein GE21DRAFT_1347933, partial [Neurospora crassa]
MLRWGLPCGCGKMGGIGEQILVVVVNEETPKEPAYQTSMPCVRNGSTFNVLRFFRHSLRTYLTRQPKGSVRRSVDPGSYAVASESHPVG